MYFNKTLRLALSQLRFHNTNVVREIHHTTQERKKDMKTDLADKFNSLSRDCTENILEAALLMSEAKESLSKSDYEDFLKLTNYQAKSSSVRKWIQIGKSYVRLKPISHNIPPVWTTIYKISTLKADQLDLLEKNNVLKPSVTAKDIDDAINTKNRSHQPKYRISIQLDASSSSEEIKGLLALIKENIASLSCQIRLTDDIETLLNSQNPKEKILTTEA
jgi:hypothetical protein